MQQALMHRGPDGEGWYEDRYVTLAMRRLAIVDPSAAKQPLFSDDGTIVVVYNGEVYNFRDLRHSLEQEGVHFQTEGDGEAIVHLYQKYGKGFVTHLNGMFAIAIWDKNGRRLHLLRDRLGEKPLYYQFTDRVLLFASEVRALVYAGVPFRLDISAVATYFHYQYPVEPHTLVAGVSKLAPGCSLTLNVDEWQVEEVQYWHMDNIEALPGYHTARIRAELIKITNSMCVSDTPIGVSLSSGIDSSAVASLASRCRKDRVHAFSVGYAGRPATDERDLARLHARRLGMLFHDIEIAETDVVREYLALIAAMDEPVADITAHAYYAVMRACQQQGVPVLLMGHGADEIFWGYDWVRPALKASVARVRTLKRDRNGTYGDGEESMLLPLCNRGSNASGRGDISYERMILFDLHPDFREGAAWCRRMLYPRANPLQYYAEEFLDVHGSSQNVPLALTKLLIRLYLMGNGLNQIDRLSMACSVEARLPFADHRLIELVLGIRSLTDDSSLGQKHWLRKSLHGVLPAQLLSRRKRPFQPPYKRWRAKIIDRYSHLLEDGFLVGIGILPRHVVGKMRRDNPSSDVVVSLSYKALCLEVWCRQLVDPGSLS